jgi:hypothetical protein
MLRTACINGSPPSICIKKSPPNLPGANPQIIADRRIKNPQITRALIIPTIGRAKNSARSGLCLLMVAIRAGFEPFFALGYRIAHKDGAFKAIRYLGQYRPNAAAQNGRGRVTEPIESPGAPSFSPYHPRIN